MYLRLPTCNRSVGDHTDQMYFRVTRRATPPFSSRVTSTFRSTSFLARRAARPSYSLVPQPRPPSSLSRAVHHLPCHLDTFFTYDETEVTAPFHGCLLSPLQLFWVGPGGSSRWVTRCGMVEAGTG